MFNKILVCLDGSELAEKVLPFAVEQAVRFDSELVLLRVVSEPYLIGLGLPGMPGIPIDAARVEKQEMDEKAEAIKYLKSLAEKIRNENKLQVSCFSTIGPAGQTIVEYCDKHKIELVALTTHGRTGPGRVILGSVADHVIRQSGLPILLIRSVKEKTK